MMTESKQAENNSAWQEYLRTLETSELQVNRRDRTTEDLAELERIRTEEILKREKIKTEEEAKRTELKANLERTKTEEKAKRRRANSGRTPKVDWGDCSRYGAPFVGDSYLTD